MNWNAPTLAVAALAAYYSLNGMRGAFGDSSVVPDAVKPVQLNYAQGLGFHMLMDVCFMIGIVCNDIAHVMMPFFVAAMLVVVYSSVITEDLASAAPAGAFALVFAYLARGAPARKPMQWNLATIFFSLQGLLLLLVGITMLSGDDAVIPEQMKPMDSLQVQLIGTTELTLAAYVFGSILTGHAQAMQPFCGVFMIVAIVLHAVIGDLEGCPLIVALATAHIGLGLFWKEKGAARKDA